MLDLAELDGTGWRLARRGGQVVGNGGPVLGEMAVQDMMDVEKKAVLKRREGGSWRVTE